MHAGVQCDACGVQPITGVRFKSVVEADYDLCETCHGAGGETPPQAPFARLALPLPGLVPPPTSAPASFVEARARGRVRGGEAAVLGAATAATAAAGQNAGQNDGQNDGRQPPAASTPTVQVVTRVPPVVTVTDLADLLSDSADVVARIMPAVAATAGTVRDCLLYTSPSPRDS